MTRCSTKQAACRTIPGRFQARQRLVLVPPFHKDGTSSGRMTNWPTFRRETASPPPFRSPFLQMPPQISTVSVSPSVRPTETSPLPPSSWSRLRRNPRFPRPSSAKTMFSSRVQAPQQRFRSPTQEMLPLTSIGPSTRLRRSPPHRARPRSSRHNCSTFNRARWVKLRSWLMSRRTPTVQPPVPWC